MPLQLHCEREGIISPLSYSFYALSVNRSHLFRVSGFCFLLPLPLSSPSISLCLPSPSRMGTEVSCAHPKKKTSSPLLISLSNVFLTSLDSLPSPLSLTCRHPSLFHPHISCTSYFISQQKKDKTTKERTQKRGKTNLIVKISLFRFGQGSVWYGAKSWGH